MKTVGIICILAVVLAAISAPSFGLPLRESSADMKEGRATGDVRFYLYTQANADAPQELFIGDLNSVKNSHFDKSRQTKVIIHGWTHFYTTIPNPQIRDAYLSQGNYNLISVDWNPYAKLNYLSARAKVPVVGEDIAEFLDFMHDEFSLNFDMCVVIGHSLGAHAAGFTGKFVKSGQLAAIVSLDPALPLYSYANTATRIASTDAKYVQSIQTNGGGNGFFDPIGSATFYPNWGKAQPGCGSDGSCSHARCVYFYAEAIRGYSYTPVYKCNSITEVSNKEGCSELQANVGIGDPLDVRRVDGIFFFETDDKEPYGHFTEKSQKAN